MEFRRFRFGSFIRVRNVILDLYSSGELKKKEENCVPTYSNRYELSIVSIDVQTLMYDKPSRVSLRNGIAKKSTCI